MKNHLICNCSIQFLFTIKCIYNPSNIIVNTILYFIKSSLILKSITYKQLLFKKNNLATSDI